MPDEMTPGEIRRSFDRIERALKDGDDRHATLASRMVPTDLWQAEQRGLLEKVDHLAQDTREAQARIDQGLSRDIRDLKTLIEREVEDVRGEIKTLRAERARRSEITWQKVTGLIAALAGAALVVVTLLSHGGGH